MISMSVKAVCLSAALACSGATAAFCANYAPIDCARADGLAQHAICHHYALGQAEARMATLYGVVTSLVAMGQHGILVDGQRKWLKARDACGSSTACLTKTYARRIRELNAVLSDIASRGPY